MSDSEGVSYTPRTIYHDNYVVNARSYFKAGLGKSRPTGGSAGNLGNLLCFWLFREDRDRSLTGPPMSLAPRKSAGQRRPAAVPPAPSQAGGRWTFLTNHAHVLILLSKAPTTVLRKVALRVGITERAVQRIIADLERDGFIERHKVGRQNSYRIRPEQPLRHPIEAHRTIGDLIDLT